MAEKAMVLFSGGVDSTTCLGLAMERFGRENVIALSIVYGQKHEKEVESARKILEYYGIKGLELDLTPIFAHSDCSLFLFRPVKRAKRRAGDYLCTLSKRAFSCFRGQHGALHGMQPYLLWSPWG